MLGLAVLLAAACALLLALLTAALVRAMRQPPRHTAGYAVAHGLAVDPGERGLSFTEWTLDRPDGARLAVWDIEPAEGGQASLPAVVFIHGWGESRIDSLCWIEPWRTLAGRIVLYDRRGHGESSGTCTLGQGEHDDLLALLERLGEQPFVLVGQSMGALIALAAATRERAIAPRISGVVAYGPYVEFRAAVQRTLRSAHYPVWPAVDLALAWLRVRGIRPLELARVDLHRLRSRALILRGGNDQIVLRDEIERVMRVHGLTIEELAESDHLNAPLSREAAHAAIIRRFVTGSIAPGACSQRPPRRTLDPEPPDVASPAGAPDPADSP